MPFQALLRDPRILILDEATSSVDPYTELIIQKGMEKLLENRTSIIIAHRLSTVRNADRIVVINLGEIVEMGNHQQLMEKGGLYSHLYEMQFREPEIEAESAPAPKIPPQRAARFQAGRERPRMAFAGPQRFQAVQGKMEEFQKLLRENQKAKGSSLAYVCQLLSKI